MQKLRNLVIVSQHYPPDRSTTAEIIDAIAEHPAAKVSVLILSGTSGSATIDTLSTQPTVVEIKNWIPAKGALIKRSAAEALFAFRAFWALLMRLESGDVVFTGSIR